MTDDSLTQRSLSALYRGGLRRDSEGVDAQDLRQLDVGGAVDPELLERLAHTPDARALHHIARELLPWSTAAAADLRRAGSNEMRETSRAHRWGWVSLAAAAGLAVCVVGLRQQGQAALRPAVADRSAKSSSQLASDDILFAEADVSMVAAAPAPAVDPIFDDSLDG